MLVKINVENFANEMINLLGLVTNECGYILSDSSVNYVAAKDSDAS